MMLQSLKDSFQAVKYLSLAALLGLIRRVCIVINSLSISQFAGISLCVGLLLFIIGIVDTFVGIGFANVVGTLLPGLNGIFLLAALAVGPMVVLVETIINGGGAVWKLPTLLLMGMWLGFSAIWFDSEIHSLRRTSGVLRQRATMDAAFTAWVEACYPPPGDVVVQPVIVAVSGGATRAALWAAATLNAVTNATKVAGIRGPALFAISSVSGGSLGAAAAMSILAGENQPCRTADLSVLVPTRGQGNPASSGEIAIADDAVGALLAGWMLNDVPRTLIAPISALIRHAIYGRDARANGGDSAEALERAFVRMWDRMPGHEGRIGFDTPYLGLFYEANTLRPGIPLWFVNGTDVVTGRRFVTSPIASEPGAAWPFLDTGDLLAVTGKDVPIATAINNGARFPYVEPFAAVEGRTADGATPKVSLVDGGYFENEGLETALELALWLEQVPLHDTRIKKIVPIVVQATAAGEPAFDEGDALTCSSLPGPGTPHPDGIVYQIFGPPWALYKVRDAHSRLLLRQAYDHFCGDPPRFVHLRLGRIDGRDVELNWYMPQETARKVLEGISVTDCQIRRAFSLGQSGSEQVCR